MQLRKRLVRVEHVQQIVSKRRYNKNKFGSIIASINFSMAKELKHSKCPVRQFRVEVTKSFVQYLGNKYGVKKRFSICQSFVENHSIVQSNQADQTSRYYVGEFSIKINNKRTKRIATRDEIKLFEANPSITIKFIKIIEQTDDEAVDEILRNFYSN